MFLITCYVTISDVSRAEGSLVDVRGRWAGPERWRDIFGWFPEKAALRCSQLQCCDATSSEQVSGDIAVTMSLKHR